MAPTGGADMQVELFEIINGAFDECARVQQDLQEKVRASIVEVLNHGQGSMLAAASSSNFQGMETVSRAFPPEVPMPLPVIPQLSLNSSVELECAQSWEPLDGIEYPNHIDDTTSAKVGPVITSPKGSLCSLPINDRLFFDGLAMTPSKCMFLTVSGKLTSVSSFAAIPPWIRLVELLLNSDTTLVSKLKQSWKNMVADSLRDRGSVISIAEASCQASYGLQIQKTYMQLIDSFQAPSVSNVSIIAVAMGRRRRIAHTFRQLLPAFPLHPSSGYRVFWDTMCMATCLYDLIAFPTIAFDFEDSTQSTKDTLDFCIAVFWTLDICLSFCTAFSDGYAIQRGYWQIASAYIRSWFLVDLMVILNVWVAVYASRSSVGALRLAKLFKNLIRGVRLIRVFKMNAHYQMALHMMLSETTLSFVKIGTQALVVTIVCHYIACGWYALHKVSSLQNTWVNEYISSDATTSWRYSTSLHWALTQLLPASISVQPVNIPERVFNIAIILISMVVFPSFISSITVNMNHLRALRVASIERESQLRKFLSQYEISNEVSHSIWSFMTKSVRNRATTLKPKDVHAFQHLPEHILERLYKDAFERHLIRHPLFEFLGILEPECMTMLCRTGLEQRFVFSSDVLWHDFTVDRMLFVTRGALVYGETDVCGQVIAKQGDWCCEEALWAEIPRMSAYVSAGVSGCELMMLKPDVFQMVIRKHCQSVNSLVFCTRYGEEFIRNFNEACKDVEDTDALFNSRRRIVHMMNSVARSFKLAP